MIKEDSREYMEWHGVIYNYGRERHGVCQKARKEKQGWTKSRRQVEIERLIEERTQLKKQWKLADDEQREGISVLQAAVRGCALRKGCIVSQP